MSTNFDKLTTQAPVDFLMKYVKGSPTLCGFTFEGIIHLPYQVLKHELPALFSKRQYDQGLQLFLACSGKKRTFKRLRRTRPEEKLMFIKWLQEQYHNVGELERRYLKRPTKPKLIRAGIRRLDELGDNVLMGTLAKEMNMTRKQVRWEPYEDLFDIQWELAIRGDIQDELDRIQKEEINAKKNRRK